MELSSIPKPSGSGGSGMESTAAIPRVLTEEKVVEGPAAAGTGDSSARRLVVGRRDEPILPGGGVTLESIIGLDERTRIVATEQAPWRMICALAIEGPWGNFVGTGWFVGPRTLVTAGHCVFEPNQMGGWANSIVVTPGANGTAEPPFKPVTATRFESTDRWIRSQDQDFDIGVIHLEEPVGEKTGWFGLASYPDDQLTGYMVNVSGYPGDKGGREQWWARNRVRGLSPRRIFYDVDTMGGQSGAPVFILETAGAPPKAVAIHAYGVGGSKPGSITTEVNSAPRLIPEVIELIQLWVEKGGH